MKTLKSPFEINWPLATVKRRIFEIFEIFCLPYKTLLVKLMMNLRPQAVHRCISRKSFNISFFFLCGGFPCCFFNLRVSKVHIFWEGHKILRNLHQLFVLCTASQIIGGDFAKSCGLLRIYELYSIKWLLVQKDENTHSWLLYSVSLNLKSF